MPFLLAVLCLFVLAGCDMGRDPDEARSLDTSKIDFSDVTDPRTFLTELQAQGAIPEADVNLDGVVDITDLVIVATNLGETVEIEPGTGQTGTSTVKIGILMTATTHRSVRLGAEAAIAQLNHDGGFLGLRLELVTRDDKGDAKTVGTLAEDLILKERVTALVGPNAPETAAAVGAVAQKNQTPMVATAVTDPQATAGGDFVFLASYPEAQQAQVMARYARDTLRASKAALLTQKGHPASESLSKVFRDTFSALGGEIVAAETYAAKQADFTASLKVIANVEPDVIYMPGVVPEVSFAVKQAQTIPQKNSAGITAVFLGADGWVNADLVKLAGAANIEGSLYTDAFSSDAPDDDVRAFVRRFRDMFGSAPDAQAALGYDAVRLIVTAMRRAGTNEKKAMRDELAKTDGYRGATTLLNYDAQRRPAKSVAVLQIVNGKARFKDLIQP